jgi:hypothetical protein
VVRCRAGEFPGSACDRPAFLDGASVLFVLGFALLKVAQPIAGALLAVVGVVLALRLPRYSTRARIRE